MLKTYKSTSQSRVTFEDSILLNDPPIQRTHWEIERESLTVLLEIEQEYRKYYEFFAAEVRKQLNYVIKLRELTGRYVLKNCNCDPPNMYTKRSQNNLAQQYYMWYEKIETSNAILMMNLAVLRPNFLKFRKLTAKLDTRMDTPLLMGDAFHKPIAYFVEIVNDIFKYMHSINLKLEYQACQLDPLNASELEAYNQMLQRNEQFEEHLLMRLTYCHCLQPKPICPKKRFEIDRTCKLTENSDAVKQMLTNKNRFLQCQERKRTILGLEDLQKDDDDQSETNSNETNV